MKRTIDSVIERIRRVRFDPSKGLEYNKMIVGPFRLCGGIYKVDIARTPQVVRDIGLYINVHAKSRKINGCRGYVDTKSGRFRGRE